MKRNAFVLAAMFALVSWTFAQNPSGGGAGPAVHGDASVSVSASASATEQNRSSDAGGKSGGSATAAASSGSSASGSAAGNSFNLADNTAIHATLMTPVDARHNKPGDAVRARTTDDVKQDCHVVLRKGTVLNGHVTQAEARSKASSQSAVGIVFENAVPKGGEEQPLHLSIQALAAATNQSSAALGDDGGMISPRGSGMASAGGGGLLGGAGRTVGSVGAVTGAAGGVATAAGRPVDGAVGAATHTAGSATGNVGGLNAAGQLTSGSSGVFGLQGLNLTSGITNQTEGSVVTSTDRNVHLDSGTQMLLTVAAQR